MNENKGNQYFIDSLKFTGLFLALIWLVKLIEFVFHLDLGHLGIYPRTLAGSVGIFTGPLVHGDVNHLISNSFPIAFLGVGLFYFYRKAAFYVIASIYLLSGFWVWVAARPAFHIGASGIVYGMMFFLLLAGFLNMDKKQISVSLIVLFLYGGYMFTGMTPLNNGVSWEAHLTGAAAGIFCAVMFRKYGKSSSGDEDPEGGDGLQNAHHTFGGEKILHIHYKKDQES